jgi:sugar/nucleoside kinase (ribokinase family)
LDQVSEPDCGVVTKRVREHLATLAERDPAKFVLADSRKQIGLFRNVCVKPNLEECYAAVDMPYPPPQHRNTTIFDPMHQLIKHTNGVVICTRGRLETIVRVSNVPGNTAFVPVYPVDGPIDICGAGDSCSAGIACAMMSGATHFQAAAFGNLVASITIQQIGVTGTATPEQVRARWREVQPQA